MQLVCFSDASWEQHSRVVITGEDGPRYQADQQTYKGCHPLSHGGEGGDHRARQG